MKNPKIFIIGFNRCGTQSLAHFFKRNNLKVLHVANEYEEFTRFVKKNLNAGNRIFGEEEIQVYADAVELVSCYKKIHTDYPNSYFILNTRDKNKWIQSRLNHGKPKGNYCTFLNSYHGVNKSKEEWVNEWSLEWDKHHKNTREYFKPYKNQFLEFNIESDPVSKIVNFLQSVYDLNPQMWTHEGATSSKRY